MLRTCACKPASYIVYTIRTGTESSMAMDIHLDASMCAHVHGHCHVWSTTLPRIPPWISEHVVASPIDFLLVVGTRSGMLTGRQLESGAWLQHHICAGRRETCIARSASKLTVI